MKRRDSLVIVACVALLGCALAVGAADGKKKGKGGNKVSVLSSQQQQARQRRGDFRSHQRSGKGRRVVVDGVQSSGKTPSHPKKAKPGKRP